MKAQLLLAALLAACGPAIPYRDQDIRIKSVESLDIARYAGRWYEIARFPNSFEKDCVAVTADYALRPDGKVSVTNTCRKNSFDGPVEVAEGTAEVVAPGQLKVKFVDWLPFAGDYWVLYVSPDYDLAVVGAPAGTTGWVLARSPNPDPELLDRGYEALRKNGYRTNEMIRTPQPANTL
jgi:apolipoprotein D and lipocalin family protein